jgi:plasmid replication initiation protein
MDNALTRAGHSLSLSEKRLVALALTKTDSRSAVPVDGTVTVRIGALEYAREFGISDEAAYVQLRAAAKALMRRVITFFIPAYKRNGQPLKPLERERHWAEQCDYHVGEGWVELHWDRKLLPHLMGLQRNFTMYELRQASALRSAYSWRLLELLTRFQSTGWAEYDIEDFAVSMDATEKQRADFAKLRTRILLPAIAELEQKDGWVIKWEPVRAGRRVRAVRFTFERDPQGRLPI